MAAVTVTEVLRRFVPDFLRESPALTDAQRRALWAITHCRTPVMGGHLHACGECGAREFAYHSCNHRSCPQCGRGATFQWVERELGKRVGAPYFMVTFTLPEELRGLFFSPAAKEVYQLFFAAASEALAGTLASPRWLGAATSGFTMVLHTWNQRLHFHPHLHCIVPGAGIEACGRVVTVKDPRFLVHWSVLSPVFRAKFRERLTILAATEPRLPAVDNAVWEKDWGVNVQAFGSGERAIQYLGAYVCRTAIGDSRIVGIEDDSVTFRWKDRANGGTPRTETLPGVEFVRRYLRHVLPRGMKAIRYYGFCHPAAKSKCETIVRQTLTPPPAPETQAPAAAPAPARPCPCCGQPMVRLLKLLPAWHRPRAATPPAPAARPPPALPSARSCA
jgi:hypothetical protein